MGIEPYRPAAAAAQLLRYSRPDGLDDGGLRPPDKVLRKQRLEISKALNMLLYTRAYL